MENRLCETRGKGGLIAIVTNEVLPRSLVPHSLVSHGLMPRRPMYGRMQRVAVTLAAFVWLCAATGDAAAQDRRLLTVGERSEEAEVVLRNDRLSVRLPSVVPLAESWAWDTVSGVLRLRFPGNTRIHAMVDFRTIRINDRLIETLPPIVYEEGTLWIPLTVLQEVGVRVQAVVTESPIPTVEELPLAPRITQSQTPVEILLPTATPTSAFQAEPRPQPSMGEGPLLSILIDPSLPPGIDLGTASGYDALLVETILDLCETLRAEIERRGGQAWLTYDANSLGEGEERPPLRDRVALGNRLKADLVVCMRGGRSFRTSDSWWTIAYHSPWMGGSPQTATGAPTWWSRGEIPREPWINTRQESVKASLEIAKRLHHDLLRAFAGEGPLSGGTEEPFPARLALAQGSLAPVIAVALGNADNDTTLLQFSRTEWRRKVAYVIGASLENWVRIRRGLGEVPLTE